MAQFSMLWTTTPNGVGDGASPFTEANWQDLLKMLLTFDPTTEGVVPGFLNDLEVTGAASPLSVNTGGAVVYGRAYWSTASESLTVTTPVVGNTGGHVILRVNWAAETVRLFAVRNTDGNAATPALTQTAGTTWEIRLATFTISTLGVITLTDARDYCHFNTALVYRRKGGSATNWNTAGSTAYTPSSTFIQTGVHSLTIQNGDFESVLGMGVTFPVAYAQEPIVLCSFIENTEPGGAASSWEQCNATIITTTGFAAFVKRGYNTAATSYSIAWVATGTI